MRLWMDSPQQWLQLGFYAIGCYNSYKDYHSYNVYEKISLTHIATKSHRHFADVGWFLGG
jgi:hypothetical protein